MSEINVVQKVHHGGGLFGKIVGGIIGAVGGAVAGAVTGNPGAAVLGGVKGAAAGTALGSTAGGLIGEAVDPSAVTGGNPVPPTQIDVMKMNPEVQMQQLQEAGQKVAALNIPPEEKSTIQTATNTAFEQKRQELEAMRKGGGGYVDQRFAGWTKGG